MRSPKLNPSRRVLDERVYNYYAGYSEAFVSDAVVALGVRPGERILDPWNGSGTTTIVAQQAGCEGIGIDINPVMVIVAKARHLDGSVRQSLPSLAADILAKARITDRRTRTDDHDDALHAWFDHPAAAWVRSVERAIHRLLVDADTHLNLTDPPALERVSSLAAFFLTGLFRVAQKHIGAARATNPTWIRASLAAPEKIRVDTRELEASFLAAVAKLSEGLRSAPSNSVEHRDPKLRLGSSESLAIADATVDAVITSPPYCTRIDYAVATRPELAVLGVRSGRELNSLRRAMIGTTTVGEVTERQPRQSLGAKCRATIEAVRAHSSYASAGYYYKTYVRYFDGVNRSINEIARVLRPGGRCAIVVQDSYYKDLVIDLAAIVTEMAESSGLEFSDREDFAAGPLLSNINSSGRKYRKHAPSIESVLLFKRGAGPTPAVNE